MVQLRCLVDKSGGIFSKEGLKFSPDQPIKIQGENKNIPSRVNCRNWPLIEGPFFP